MLPLFALLYLALVCLIGAIGYGIGKIVLSAPREEENFRNRRSPGWDETRPFGDLHYAQIGEEGT